MMKTAGSPLLRLAVGVLTLAATAGAEPAKRAGEWLNWTGANRKVIRARFLDLQDTKLTLELQDGTQATVDLERLDPTSRKQALTEADRRTDQPIADLRGMEFVRIPKGWSTMGSPPDEKGRVTNGEPMRKVRPDALGRIKAEDLAPKPDYEPEREVGISKTFWMKKTEVTWSEWNAVLSHAEIQSYLDIGKGRNGYLGDGSGNHPVTEITWFDAIKWCNLKSQIENLQPVYHTAPGFDGSAIYRNGTPQPVVNWEANGYRLPTEAEWEYACRQGRSSNPPPFYHGKVAEIAWFEGNSGGNTHPVATTRGPAHRYGLHDMHGNVAEWCWDWAGTLLPGRFEDPRGPDSGTVRVFRGGSWADPERCLRAAYRGTLSPSAPASCIVGFRPVCGVDPAQAQSPAR